MVVEGPLRVSDLALPEWSAREILIEGYQVVQTGRLEVGCDIRLGDVRVLLYSGEASWVRANDVEVREVDLDSFEVILGPIERITGHLGTYMYCITPHDGSAGERVAVAAPMAAAILGGAVIYRNLFTNIYNLDDGSVAVRGPAFGHPKNYRHPSVDGPSIRRYKEAYLAIEHAPARGRIELSLRWFEEAHHTSNEDALLRFWFAIETLALPSNETNIKPANQLLARAYGVTTADIVAEIELGRIYGLRCAIVHDGMRPPLDMRLLNFVAAVYVDLLEATLGLPCQRRATAIKAEIGASIAHLIPKT